MNINDISPDEIQNITHPKPININDINENEIEAVSLPMPEPQPQAEPTGMTNEIRQTLAPEVEPDLSLFQRFAGGPVGDALAGIGNIARQSQTVSPEVLAVAQQQTVIPSKEEVVATLINNAQQGAQAIRNVPTAVGGLAAMIPSFATDIARGGTDILAGGAEMLGADQLGRRIKEEGKLAADTAKQLAAESTANLRQFYEGKPTDVEGEMLAEELQPSKKQGALAKAMTTKFLWDAENMPPDAFKAKYPEALPIDTFNAKFEEVLRGQSLPQTVKSFFFDMPLESVKTIYGAIAGDPEVRQRFIERPAETIVETGVGLGIGIKGGKELYKATKDIAKKATVFEKPQTIDEAAASKMQSEREMTDFLRKNTEQRDAMRQEQAQQAEVMTGAPNRGMSAEELASTMREPAPQNMEATTEFLTRKPTVIFGEAERLKGEEVPTGGMTINRQARPTVTIGGEGERTGEAIPEGKGMTVQPTAPTNKLDQLFKRESTTLQPKKEYGYLMNARPFSIGAQPKGQVRVNERTDGRYGTIYYDRPLTEQEMKSYELKPEGPIVYKDVTDNPFYNDIKDLKAIDTDKSADNILELTGSDKPIFLRNGKERIAVITPSAKQKGKFQATKFDERGPIGDAVSSTPKEAIKSLIEDGYKELSNEQEFTELTFDTKETQRQEVIRNINKPSTPSPEPQQATEVAPKDITPQPAEPTAIKTPETDIKNFYKYNEESQNNIMSAQQFESASIERSDGNPAIKTIIYRWEPKPNGNGGKLLKDVFLDNKKESSEIYNEYENKIDAVKDAYNNISTNRSDRKSFFIDKDVKKYDTEVQTTKTKNERRAKITEQVQSEVDNKVQEIEQIKNDLNTKYHTELAREYKAAGILFEKVKPSKYRKTFKGQIQPIVTKENQKQIKEISSRIMDKIKKENKVAFDEITNFKADDYKNKLIEERMALSEGKPVPPEVLAEYPDLKQEPRPKSGPGMFEGAELQNEEISKKTDWSAPHSKVIIDENDARFIERFKQKGIDINLAKIAGSIEKMPKELLTKLAEGYDIGSDAVEALYRYVKGEQKPEITKYFNNKGEEVQHNPEAHGEIELTLTNNGHSISNTPPKGTKAREVIDRIIKEHEEKNNLDIMQNIAGDTTIGTLKDWLKGPDATEMFKDVLDTQVIIRPEGPTNTTVAWVPSDGEAIYLNSSRIKTVGMRYLKNAITHEAQHLIQVKKGQKIGGQNYLPYKERPAEIEAHAVGEKYRTGRLSMFGAGTLQNAYEKVEPTLKKGADILFKKGKQAYETVKRNADLTRDMGRVIDITEKEGRPVETEAPLRQGPRFIGGKPTQKGAFNPSAIIDAISSVVGGKKKERPFEVTIGDPALAKEFEKTFKATQAAETDKKQTAKAREQSTMSAYKQGLVDLFSPIIDRVPKGPEREKVMSIVHDIFYLGSPAEAFMRKTKDIVLDKVKHEDYASYMAAKAITTFREHIEKPDRIKLAEDFLKSIDPKTIKDYEKITNEWHEKAWKPILEELKASGLGDPLIINNIMGNENYAPFFPAKQLGLPHGIGENAPGAGIYKLKGGMGDYMDVLAAKMKKGIAMIAAAKINQGKLAAIDSMLQYDKNNIKEAMPEYKGFYKERDPLTGKMLEIPIVEFPEPQPGSGLALMDARRDGKKVGYYVPKEIARAFDMAMGEGDTLGATMRGFQKMTQGFRNVWIEYNPIWQVAVNAPRDIMASVIEMPKIGNKFKFMGNLAKVAPAAVGDYVPVLGKIVQAFTGYDRKAFEKDVTKALGESKLMSTREPQYLGETDTTVGEGLKRAYGLTEKHTGIAKALDTIQEFGKDIERMTKIAANLTLEGDKRFSDPEVKNIVRQIGSPAFGVRGGGDLFKTIKTATMFYNATKQSWVAAKYFLEKDPIGAIAFASVPMGLYAATIAAENGVFGDDMEKAYTLMKGYDKENKLNFPIGYKDNGEVEYISLPLPQFLKPVMRIMRTAAKENPKFLDSIIKGFSEELPMLNPVVGLVNRITSYGDEKPPAAELSGQEIMTQDQWDAGGSIKGSAFLKAFWNDYLLGSQIRLKVKPNERNETWEDKAIRFVFGKVYKTNFNEDLDTSATRQKQALQRLKTREAATAETPQEQQKIIQDMVKEGYTPQKNVFKNVKQRQFVENLRKTNAPAARQMEIYLSGKSKEEKIKAFQKLNDLLKKKKK